MSNMNPLSKFTKIEEISTKLVSNGVIPYKEGVLGTKGVKCGVCARSARDEMILNTPDMLLNGQAISKVIENCVPNVLNADDLYVNDIEQLLIAIKVATKEETYDVNTKCPECDHEGRFERNLTYLLDTAAPFKKVPTIDLDNGLSINFRPFTWGEYSEFSERMYTLQQTSKYLEIRDDLSDEEKIKEFKDVFEKMAELNFDMITGVIWKIVTPDEVIVEEKEFISEWLGQQSKIVLKQIREKMDEVLDKGISHTMDVECSHCQHQWTIEGLKYDPSNFFDFSFSSQNQNPSNN